MYFRRETPRTWRDPRVSSALSWYLTVAADRAPAKFLIARSMSSAEDPRELDSGVLRDLHSELSREFSSIWRDVRAGARWSDVRPDAPDPVRSYLGVKVELARRLASPCELCERRCRVDRTSRRGVCLQPLDAAVVHDWFLHPGEEDPLVPSGTIFYGGCNFRCVFCQNHEVSQTFPLSGIRADAPRLAAMQEDLRSSGALNINHVGGEPTPALPTILGSMLHLRTNVPQLWNSNFYMSREAMELLMDVIDIWLPDFKYGNDACALRLSGAPRYVEVVTRNLSMAASSGDMIIRHLVLPGHVDCCTKPVLRWISENVPRDRVLVNVMDQYRPEHLVARRPGGPRWREISRRPSAEEIREAREYAGELGLVYEPVS
ncbi:MAG: radical SAM protein [Conexivisphaera sp.]